MTTNEQNLEFSPLARRTLTAQIYAQLQGAISSGQLKPGQKLVIDALARRLNVSITPVREALMRLQREGLVTEVPYSGMHVSKPSVEELRELFAMRGVLEGYAIRLATGALSAAELAAIGEVLRVLEDCTSRGDAQGFRQHNDTFHNTILARAGGVHLPALIADLTRNTERYRLLGNVVLDQVYLEAAQAEHRQLFVLLQQRRAGEAEQLARTHALTFVNHLSRCLEAGA